MINGPAGKLVNLKIKIPKKGDAAPKNVAKKVYWDKFLLRFLAAAAGIATRAAVKSCLLYTSPSPRD